MELRCLLNNPARGVNNQHRRQAMKCGMRLIFHNLLHDPETRLVCSAAGADGDDVDVRHLPVGKKNNGTVSSRRVAAFPHTGSVIILQQLSGRTTAAMFAWEGSHDHDGKRRQRSPPSELPTQFLVLTYLHHDGSDAPADPIKGGVGG